MYGVTLYRSTCVSWNSSYISLHFLLQENQFMYTSKKTCLPMPCVKMWAFMFSCSIQVHYNVTIHFTHHSSATLSTTSASNILKHWENCCAQRNNFHRLRKLGYWTKERNEFNMIFIIIVGINFFVKSASIVIYIYLCVCTNIFLNFYINIMNINDCFVLFCFMCTEISHGIES